MAVDIQEDARLRALRELGLLNTPPSEAFDRITRMAGRLFGLPISVVSLTDEDRQWFKSRVGLDVTQLPRHKAPCAQVASSCDVVVVPDLLEEEFYRDSPLAQSGARFYAGAPLVTREGFGLGSMCVVGLEPRTVTAEELTGLRDLAAMVMAQIELQHALGRIEPVSGLPNRNQLIEDLEDFARDHANEARVAVLVSLAETEQLSDASRAVGPSYVDDLVRFGKNALSSIFGATASLYQVGNTDLLLLAHDEPLLREKIADAQMLLSASVETSSIPVATHSVIGIAPFLLGQTAPVEVLRMAYGAALDAREAGLTIETHSQAKDERHQRRFALLQWDAQSSGRARPVQARLSTANRDRDGRVRQRRGAAPLGPSHPRQRPAGRVHSACGAYRHDWPSHGLGDRGGAVPDRRVASPRA